MAAKFEDSFIYDPDKTLCPEVDSDSSDEDQRSNISRRSNVSRKSDMHIERLESDLADQKKKFRRSRMEVMMLEQKNGELRAKLTQYETEKRTKADMESNIEVLKKQLENERKERLNQQKINRKLEKKLKDLSLEIEDERIQVDDSNEQIERLKTRIKQLRTSLDETEEKLLIERTQMRRYQRECEDLSAGSEILHLELSVLKSRLNWDHQPRRSTITKCDDSDSAHESIIS